MERRRRIGAYGIARDEQGRLLLVRSSARSNHPGRWFLPGGGLNHGEDPAAGLAREFLEETGLTVRITGLHGVSSDLVDMPWRGVLLHHDRVVYDVEVVGGELTVETAGTSDLPAWVEPARLAELPVIPFVARTLGLPEPVGDGPAPPAADESGELSADGRLVRQSNRVMRFGAYGIVTDPAGRVLLSLTSPGYPGAGHWHLPGGGTDFGEQPHVGLLREIYEETGQVGEVTELVEVGSSHNPAAVGPEGVPLDWYVVRAVFRVTVADPTVPVVTEVSGSTCDAAWFHPAELGGVRLTDMANRELRHIR
ncbi:NUDIX domain-containing protein [Catellatospora sp. KI3]|uniref:NUDIX hydrolase n=1 Tax=Catellatospora sp. KI3 TaxID=3041620 RepID=UPI002482AE12|nr:NUDIX domain-containing protein [Catellatospora sp. KI3]MDI1460333.1 NUDIX domain-containing protein [Catellatospora sp. KI3]